jgi:DNA-binding transcriptional LysR family regulator
MELRQLEYLVEVDRAGTYVAAASSLSIAQPALWRQVKALEEELGTPLFERVGRRVRLTRDGRAIVEQAQAVVAAAEHLRGVAADIRAGHAGHVAIACAAPHLRAFLAPVIARFGASHPRAEVTVREYGGGPGPGRGMREDLLDGTVDLATGVPPDDDRFESIPLYSMRLVVAVPDGHPWRREPAIEIERLRRQPLVTAQPGSYSRGAIEAACTRAGFSPVIGFDSPNPLSIIALGEAGLGLPVLVDDALPSPASGAWPRLVEQSREVGATIRLGWRAGAQRSTAVRAFVDLAREEASRGGLAP